MYIYDMVPYKLQIHIFVCIHYMFDVWYLSVQEVQKENSLEKVCYQTFWSNSDLHFSSATVLDRIFAATWEWKGPGVDCYTARLFKNGTEDFGFKPLRPPGKKFPKFPAANFLGHDLRKDMLCLLGE